MKTAAVSVPMVSEPWPSRWPPTQITETIAIAPRNSMPGKNSELSHCACVLVCRFAQFARSNSPRNARSRLNAWMTAMPETDSAICAVMDEIVSRTRRNAACDLTWNQRVRTSVGGRITSATSPSRQSSTKSPTTAAISVSVLTTSVVSPCERTSESASTSEVNRAMIQPAFCCEK